MSQFARLWHQCRWSGSANLPASGPAVLVANHPSHADPAFLIAASGRPLHFLHARECYEVPILRHLFALVGCIPVTRGDPDVAAMRQALKVLDKGGVVVVFIEGEVGESLRPGKTGAAMLAIRGHAPVVPAWIERAGRDLGVLGSWLIPSGGVQVTIGEPIDLAEFVDRPITHCLLREATDRIMDRLAELSRE